MKKFLFLGISTLTISTAASAQHTHDHDHDHHARDYGWYGHLDTQTYFTDIYKAEEDDEEISDVFTHSHFETGYLFGNGWSLNGNIKLEGDPAGHSHGDEAPREGDQFFDAHPLFIEELTVNYDTDHYGAYVGKFNPLIGRDVHNVPGWWGMLTFEEFDIRERIGAGGYVDGEIVGLGHQRFELSTFFADTTFLQQTALFDREDLGDDDGGIANTEDFSSIAANLSGELGTDNLDYYLGYARQANDDTDGDDENRISFGLNYNFALNAETNIELIADLTDINHYEGESDHDRRYSTLGFGVNYHDWVAGATYTDIHNEAGEAEEDLDGYTTQFSIGYNFTDHFGADLGYQRGKEEGETSNRIGALVRYNIGF